MSRGPIRIFNFEVSRGPIRLLNFEVSRGPIRIFNFEVSRGPIRSSTSMKARRISEESLLGGRVT